MKHAPSSFALFLALVLPLLASCTSSTDDSDPADHGSARAGLPVTPRINSAGCTIGFDCTPAATCPDIVPPAPGFCAGGTKVPRRNAQGCLIGFDCLP